VKTLYPTLPFLLYAALVAFSDRFWSLSHLYPIRFALIALFGGVAFASPLLLREHSLRWKLRLPASIAGLIAVVSIPLFYLARNRLFLPPPAGNGDSIHLIQHLPLFTELFGYLDSFDEILELFFRSKLHRLLSPYGVEIETSYALLSAFAGGLYLFVFLRLIVASSPSVLAAIAIVLLAPPLELYAGYVENYTLAALFLFTILVSGVDLIRSNRPLFHGGNPFTQEKHLVAIALLSAIGAMFHLLVTIAAPALLYLVFVRSANRRAFFTLAIAASAPALLIIALTWGYFLFGIDAPVALSDSFLMRPPFLSSSALVSANHFRNEFNLLLLASPSLPILVAFLFFFRDPIADTKTERMRRFLIRFAPTPSLRFLLIATVSYLLEQFFHNPMLGFPCDWDLFTFFHVPLNLYLYFLFLHRRENTPSIDRVLPAVLVINLVLTAGWLYRNGKPDGASEFFLAHAKKISSQTLRSIRSDPLYDGLDGLDRKKRFARFELFYNNAVAKIDGWIAIGQKNGATVPIEPERLRRMRSDLQTARNQFRDAMLLPEPEYSLRIDPVWKQLTEINIALSDLPPPLPPR